MLRILIVEDDSQLAATLKYLVEDNPRYRVVATADDADSAIAAAEFHDPDLVLLDLHLAHGSTGFSVAARLSEFGVLCLFVSGKAPSFPMPDLAIGCLMKPFTAEDVHRSLAMAEDMLRGRETHRPKLPRQSDALRAHPTSRRFRNRGSFPRRRHSGRGSSTGFPRTTGSRARAASSPCAVRAGPGLGCQRRPGVEQSLPPLLDLGAALDVFERQQRRRCTDGRACG